MIGRWNADERLRFLAIGGWNTVFGYLCFVGLYWLLRDRLHYLLIGIVAHAIAALNAFFCHRIVVFRSHGPVVAEFVRFNLALLFVLGYGLLALWFCVTVLHLSPLLGQAIVTASAVVVSFVTHRRFSFAA